jgi:hypothetical protein
VFNHYHRPPVKEIDGGLYITKDAISFTAPMIAKDFWLRKPALMDDNEASAFLRSEGRQMYCTVRSYADHMGHESTTRRNPGICKCCGRPDKVCIIDKATNFMNT